jgi:hypothetical protein
MTKYTSCRSWPNGTEVRSFVFRDSRITVIQIKFVLELFQLISAKEVEEK